MIIIRSSAKQKKKLTIVILFLLSCAPVKSIQNIKYLNNPNAQFFLNKPTAYAVIIGIQDYPDDGNDLEKSFYDMLSIKNLLVNKLGYAPENIFSLFDLTANSKEIEIIFHELELKMTEEDTLFFFYSGHGDFGYTIEGTYNKSIESQHDYENDVDQLESVYHSGVDGIRVHFTKIDVEEDYDAVFIGDWNVEEDPIDMFTGSYEDVWSAWVESSVLKIELYSDESNTGYGYSVDKYQTMTYNGSSRIVGYDSLYDEENLWSTQLDNYMDRLACAEIYVVVDSCYSGGFINDLVNENRLIMTSCSYDLLSLEDDEFDNSIFTNYFVKSFEMDSNYQYIVDANHDFGNQDGILTWNEVFEYVRYHTELRSALYGYTHTPQLYNALNNDRIHFPRIRIFEQTDFNLDLFNLNFEIDGSQYLRDVRYNLIHPNGTINEGSFYQVSGLHIGEYEIIDLDYGYSGYVIYADYTTNRHLIAFDSINQEDSDNDTIPDNIEEILGTSPNLNDTDGDGLSDFTEISIYGTNPCIGDSDGDLLNDYEELANNYTTPYYSDYDNDGLTDYMEFIVYNTLASESDSDQDGFDDYFEITSSTDPLDRLSFPGDGDETPQIPGYSTEFLFGFVIATIALGILLIKRGKSRNNI